MSVTSAYATPDQYRARTGDLTEGSNSLLDAQLVGTTRELERALGLAVGFFNAHSATYSFDGNGASTLYLRDRAARAYCLRGITTDSLSIDSDMDGTAEYTLDLADAWVRGLPENAATAGEPYTALELLSTTTATITKFPKVAGAISIASTQWGWAAVPDMVTELVCHRTYELREQLKAGGADSRGISMLPAFGDEVRMRPQTAWLWREVEGMYGRWLPMAR